MKQAKLGLFILLFFLTVGDGFAATRGFYLDFHGGPTSQDDMFFGPNKVSFDDGTLIGGAVGYDYGFFRVEGELAHRSNDADQFSFSGLDLDARGEVTLTSFLINFLFEYDNTTPLVPYAGFGFGWGKMDFDNVSAGGTTLMLDNDTGAMYQLILGLGYNLNDRWRLFADYRGLLAPISSEDDPDDDRTDDDYFNNALALGVTCYF